MKAGWFKRLLALLVTWNMMFLPLQVYASQIVVNLDAKACQHMLHDAASSNQSADPAATEPCLKCLNDCSMGHCNGHCKPINSVLALPVDWQEAQTIFPARYFSTSSDHIQGTVPSGLFRPPQISPL